MKLFNVIQTSFENFDKTIKSYLTKALGEAGQQYSGSQIYGVIFEGIKNVMQNAMFYIEDALTEQNIETAFRKSSIYSLAKLSGYDAYYGSAATGLINCEISLTNVNNVGTSKVYIKNGSSIINHNTGIKYLIMLPTDYIVIDLTKPLVTTQFKIVQGNWGTTAYVSNGEPLETMHITTQGLYDRDYIEVTVDGEKYSPAPCLYDMTKDSKEFVVTTGYNNELDIMFGNGTYGRQIKSGQTVIIRYLKHSGQMGNILIDEDVDFDFSDSVYDANGQVIKDVNFLNLYLGSSISGGSQSDTVSNIREMIGYNSRSLVLASENNFRQFLSRFSFIGQSNIWSDSNTLDINIVCVKNYKDKLKTAEEIFNAPTNLQNLYLDNNQKRMVIDTINNSNKTFAGIQIKFSEPIVYKYSVVLYVKLKDKYDKESIREHISTVIANYFLKLSPNTSYISKSEIIKKLVDEVPYIESVDLMFVSDQNELAYKNGYYWKYDLLNTNGTTKYNKTKKLYDSSMHLGLDDYGNISVDGKFEIPVISNEVKYYPEHNGNKNNSCTLPAVQCIFI